MVVCWYIEYILGLLAPGVAPEPFILGSGPLFDVNLEVVFFFGPMSHPSDTSCGVGMH